MKTHLQEAPKICLLAIFRKKNKKKKGKSVKWLEVVVMTYLFVDRKDLQFVV